jgi:thiamine-phosphate pyrophosphorylase
MVPKLHYISQGNTPKQHLENIQKACTSGIELVQLALYSTSQKKLLNYTQKARDITAHFQTRLIITDHCKIAKAVKADGVHFSSLDTFPANVKTDLYSWQLVSGSANSMQDCEKLLDKQVSYMYLGPFKKSAKDTTLPLLGLTGYSGTTALLKTGTPIMGFGGITTQDVTAILKAGLSGVAVSDAITNDFNAIKIFHELLKSSATAEQRYSMP